MTGVFAGSDYLTVDDMVGRAQAAVEDGFDTIWYPQVMSIDALTGLCAVAREVPDIALGTSVVPIQGRHPFPLALQALAVADAAGPGRFTLGLGVTHPVVSEGWFGVPYKGMVELMDETMTALNGLFSDERRADVDGEHLTVHASTPVQTPGPEIMLAALGPRMLEVCGRTSAGTITWMTGPRAVEERIAPALPDGARIVVGLPVCVAEAGSTTKERMTKHMATYATMPSYRKQVEAERVDHPVDLAIIGSADEVTERLAGLEAAGMTEFLANVVGSPDEIAATRELLTR